jgi:uncharacterized membrane protein YraQ (UPF0718 family)
MKKKYKIALKGTFNNIKNTLPILFAIILLISWVINSIPDSFYNKIFTGNNIIDSFLGALIGSVATGNPVNSYIIGIKLLEKNVGLVAVTAFIISWVTVGVVQFPAEALLLGKKFALTRNIISFISAIVISILTVLILQFL